jgi:hypothetical protein
MAAKTAQNESPFKRADFREEPKRGHPPRGGTQEVLSMPMDSEARALMLELSLPLDPPRREAFLVAVTERLEASPVSGPGAVMAAGRELQRQYFDVPNVHGGQTGRRI